MCPATPRTPSAAPGRRIDRGQSAPGVPPAEKPLKLATARVRLLPPTRRGVAIAVVVVVAVAGSIGAYALRGWWLPPAGRLLAAVPQWWQGSTSQPHAADDHPGEAEAAGDHDHTGSDDADPCARSALELSARGRKNVGLELMTVRLQAFARTINVPAVITERPGRTAISVSAPMTGIVTRIYPIQGEAVLPGAPLFELRLTHEDLVDAQSAFLETVEQLDVIEREIGRLEGVTASGAVAGKALLERQYEKQQAEARRRAQRQALLLHGLSEQQVDQIEATRRLLAQATVCAPQPAESAAAEAGQRWLQVARLNVNPGQHVNTGDVVCVLRDHAVLHIEGKAFEEDFAALNEAARQGTPITAVIEADGKVGHSVGGLKIIYIDDEVEAESRALRFYVALPNQQVRNEQTADGQRFVGWRFRPGQRVQLLIPVERWENRIVLPVEAVVQDGPEWFVFRYHEDHFDRQAVHVEYRDQRWAVLASDGALSPGDVVVAAGAFQMHLAMKNKAGGIDAHAGHHH